MPGLRPADAADMADALVWADLRGLEPHGVSKLPLWLERLRRGGTRADAIPSVVAETDTTAVLDAQRRLRSPRRPSRHGARRSKARRRHLAAVVIRDSSSLGAMGYYPPIAAEAGLIGLAITNSMPLLAPTGGAARLLGNQAYAIGYPAGRHVAPAARYLEQRHLVGPHQDRPGARRGSPAEPRPRPRRSPRRRSRRRPGGPAPPRRRPQKATA